jgi:large subunit ribosomal protein L9
MHGLKIFLDSSSPFDQVPRPATVKFHVMATAQVILKEKIEGLGAESDVVKVRAGYARNFLIPSGRARRATAVAIKEFEVKRAELEKIAAAKLAECQAQGAKLSGTVVKLTQKAGVDGRLFGSVTNADIAQELSKQGFAVLKSQIRMPNGPLKIVGDHPVSVALHTDVTVDVTVTVYGETA